MRPNAFQTKSKKGCKNQLISVRVVHFYAVKSHIEIIELQFTIELRIFVILY